MSDQPPTPPDEPASAMGVEPEEVSGAGYGNHAPDSGDDIDAEPSEEGNDGR